MRNYQRVLMVALALAALCLVHAAAQTSPTEVRSSLSGKVSWVAQEGDTLPPGGELVRIKTLTGEAAAARVEEPSEVASIEVAVGDEIAAGMVVAKVRPIAAKK